MRHTERVGADRFKAFAYDEFISRDKTNLDVTWLRDEPLEDVDNLPAPDVIGRENVEDLTAALAVRSRCRRPGGQLNTEPST